MVERRGWQAPFWRSLNQAGDWFRHFLPIPGHRSEEGAMSTVPPLNDPDDRFLRRFGYRQRFLRSLRPFESFGIGFSFISVTMALFVTFGFLLSVAGPRGIWIWPVAFAGQILVCLVCAALAAKFPLAGVSYQWGSRLANPTVGWWLGWLGFTTLVILTASVDYAFVQLAFQPMLGIAYTPLGAAVQTSVVLVVQATLIIGSTILTTQINNVAVVFEVVGMVELSIVLFSAALLAGQGDWGNVWSTGTVPEAGWFSWLGPVMLATVLGSFTLLGFEQTANLAEETHDPRRVVPKAMIRSLLAAGVIGMLFLIAVSVATGDVAATTADPAPVAFILKDVLGAGIEKIFLFFICVSMFCCGLITMTVNTRLVWAMARDRRLPGHQLLSRVPRPTGGPTWATLLAAVVPLVPLVAVRSNTGALVDMFTAGTLMPAVTYALTVLLYAAVAHRLRPEPGYFRLGRWERPVVTGALIWLAYELIVLLGPDQFRAAQRYALIVLLLGVIVFGLVWLLEPAAMRRQADPLGEQAGEAMDEPLPEPEPARLLS
jgi:amino acid transporter